MNLNELSEESWWGICGVLTVLGIVGVLVCCLLVGQSISTRSYMYDAQKVKACVTADMQWDKGNCLKTIPVPAK